MEYNVKVYDRFIIITNNGDYTMVEVNPKGYYVIANFLNLSNKEIEKIVKKYYSEVSKSFLANE